MQPSKWRRSLAGRKMPSVSSPCPALSILQRAFFSPTFLFSRAPLFHLHLPFPSSIVRPPGACCEEVAEFWGRLRARYERRTNLLEAHISSNRREEPSGRLGRLAAGRDPPSGSPPGSSRHLQKFPRPVVLGSVPTGRRDPDWRFSSAIVQIVFEIAGARGGAGYGSVSQAPPGLRPAHLGVHALL